MKILMRAVFLYAVAVLPSAAQLTPANQQAVVAVTSGWSSSHANLYCYEMKGGKWTLAHGPMKARLGKKGSAWGIGAHQSPTGATMKKEGDRRSPAGIFYIGGAWGDAATIKKHAKLPYRKVTPRDLWVEDSNSPYYNQHRIIGHAPKTPWEKKQQMKQGDYAHALKLFIGHNPPPKAKPKAGSAIFFHIWRGGGSKSTAGCTTMSKANLEKLVAWVNPDKQPVYILLPQVEYKTYRAPWKLP